MPVPQALVDALKQKLLDQRPSVPVAEPPGPPGPPINLAELKEKVTAALADDPTALVGTANTNYDDITAFIRAMNPYGHQVVMFPSLKFNNPAERAELSRIREERGIEIAGWLRKNYATAALSSSDMEMTLADKAQCFYWDFRYPDDPAHPETPKGGEMSNLQITKAIRIPFIYRRADGELLLGHVVIGYEGAGSM